MRTTNSDTIKEFGEQFNKEAHVVDGVVRWNSNNIVPPTDILQGFLQAGKEFNLEKSLKARDQEDTEFLKQYREAMKDYTPSAEDLFEMRAAFGEGTTVVNVITGKKTRL